MSRPIQARIDLSALERNLHTVRRLTRARIMAVIKANAYGHGLLHTAEALQAADGFALLNIGDAVRLREAGFRQTILLLEGVFGAEEMPLLAEYDLAAVLHSPHQLAMLDAYPRRGSLSLWLKVNTGMNRLGFEPQALPAVMSQLKEHAAVRDVTLMTHFANADIAGGVAVQLERFNTLAAAFNMPRSLANSAALLRYPATHGDWVRPGIMLYGSSPFAETSARDLGLRPVMTLSSEIISVRDIQSGETVGYGGLFRADRRMRIGVVACGYADGYPRHAPTGTPVLVNGQRTRTLGRVSMDMLSVDLSALPDADVGSRVVLWGGELPVDEVARSAETISYELLCALAARVPVTV
ncbi:MAG: alanine racemase [Gallionellales bacterium 35-53-114]|nr:MAG: alanine racemase [Gallionellales bacterium 35-53-114]OYZ62139.1 MAG: alanine racemase [Gallionellales bacterium 24-53-125]OZB07299.1 MAG: alanine racemase [Gallionellales bacterium 39-52-133]HQS59856.1 alanine racemase [Gallionellaceae bacterium]HQS76610.1 alanine racemase [Gallionellaceae bacterium]